MCRILQAHSGVLLSPCIPGNGDSASSHKVEEPPPSHFIALDERRFLPALFQHMNIKNIKCH